MRCVLAGTATIGSYTTFSTWMLETHRLAEDGEIGRRCVNVGVSLAVGSARRALGRAIGAHAVNDDCLKLTTYFGERDRTADGLLADELLDVYGGHRLQASILLRGAEGFGRLQHLHTDRLLIAVGGPAGRLDRRRRARADRSGARAVLQIKRTGLITLERARLLSGEIGPDRAARGARRGDQADRLRRSPGARRPRAGVRGRVRAAAPTRRRRRHRAARRRRDPPRATAPARGSSAATRTCR